MTEENTAKNSLFEPPGHGLPSQFVRDCLNANEAGDGELYARLNRSRFIWVAQRDRWYKWAGHSWDIDYLRESYTAAEAVAEAYIEEARVVSRESDAAVKVGDKDRSKFLDRLYSDLLKRVTSLRGQKRRRSCLEFAATAQDPLAIVGNELDTNPWMLVCGNGVLDMRTGEIRPGRQDDWLSKSTATLWPGLDAACPEWDSALLEIFDGHQDLVDYIQRACGYAMIGANLEHSFFIWFGEGRNGKSLIQDVLCFVLGDYSGPIQSEMLLDNGPRSTAGPSPDVMSLKGLRLAFATETPEGRRFNASKVKWFTGNDILVGRSPNDKYETRFRPTHQLFLLTNHLPHVSADDRAFWARAQAVEFTQRFCDNPMAANERLRDKNLYQKLQQLAPGILAWLVRGCLAWHERGLDPPPIVVSTTEKYRTGEDIMAVFIAERCELGDTLSESSSDLCQAYQQWYADNISKKSVPSSISIGKKLTLKFPDNYKSGGYTMYRGVRLVSQV